MPAETSFPNDGGRSVQDRRMREQARQRAGDKEQQIEDRASQTADRAREKAEDKLSEQKQRATGQLENVSSALRDTSSNLRDQQQENIAGYVDSAAEQVDRLSSYVRNRTVGQLVDDVQDVARREPALFIGGAMLLGVFGARFFKSSQSHGSGMQRYRGSRHYRDRPYREYDYDDMYGNDVSTYRTYERDYISEPENVW